MNIKEITDIIENVGPYEKGTHIMWTDEHIAKHLLDAHINPDINLASRKPESIDKIVNWMIEETKLKNSKILDLGCGPGLYTQRLAQRGHDVVGMDFSKNSIEYAKNQAKENNLHINYICKNYLEMEFEEEFDLITMIYCDFGVLSIEEREILIHKIYKSLKPNGSFILDSLNENTINNLNTSKQWEVSKGGFWKEEPYICLSQSFHFQEYKATLDQHVVFDENSDYKLYRFWNHYFNKEDMNNIFTKVGFKNIKEYKGMLENDGEYNDEGVSFYKIDK